MKQNNIRNYSFKWFLTLSVFFVSCNNNTTSQSDEATSQSPTSQEVSNTAAPRNFYINSSDNKAISEIIAEQHILALHGEQHDLIGELKGEKRKYYDQNDELKYTVKYKPDGSFKVRDANELMRWKIKYDDDKIKVSDNEEMTNAYKIYIYDNGKLKIKQNDEELDVMRFSFSEANINVKDKYNVRNFGASTAIGILLIEDIPEIEKYIICAELLKANK